MAVVDGDPAGARGLQQADDRGPGRAGPGQHDPDVAQRFPGHPQRVDQGPQDHDSGTVLVIVKHRHVEDFPQSSFQFEAARRRDILRAHTTESRRHRADAPHHLAHIRHSGQASIPANLLYSAALPSSTGSAAREPTSPSPSTAEQSLTTATEFPRMVSRRAAAGSSAMARQSSATPGV